MDRRGFLKTGLALGLGAFAPHASGSAGADDDGPQFQTADPRWQAAYDAALAVLHGNVRTLAQYPRPILIEGAQYSGIWMECGPTESLVYRKYRPEVARHSHEIFFACQRPDGQFPAAIRSSRLGFGQIQMVVPIAATAWELARATKDQTLLHSAYSACSRWEEWLERYRNHRGTGLVEGVCTYDTGNDNSPRWAGMPNACPGGDARRYPPEASLPRLCPDLSATSFGASVALAQMANALGRPGEVDRWTERAAVLRAGILSRLYSPEDAAFYDLDAQDRFVRIRSEIITRVCGEHVPDAALFDQLWRRQLHAPQAFWPPYPFPSIAVDDPHFVRPIPHNSWGGASQALTALRAGRWMDHYGRSAEFHELMDAWCEAIQRDLTFRQQVDPLSGVFTPGDSPGYSPCALVMVDFSWRLAGIVETPEELWWNVRPSHPAAKSARFRIRTDSGTEAVQQYGADAAELWLSGRRVARVAGGSVRVVTDRAGRPHSLVGISLRQEQVTITWADRPAVTVTLAPNQVVAAALLRQGYGGQAVPPGTH